MTAKVKEQQSETVQAKATKQPACKKPIREAVKRKPASKDRKRIKVPVRKQDIILKLLKRSKGVRMQDLQKATGWKAHSIRAALTGLRRKGVPVERQKGKDGVSRYSLAGEKE
ncbi:MAG: DUF3489 domain-containing protein [Alphaproteobacteria bacterium]|nr:MAG: DUF3489 domain-containing protein [Alphaproteobacteria bacterium]